MNRQIILISFFLILSNSVFARDFENPHEFNPGDVLSADMLNDLFGNLESFAKSISEDDLVGSWSCDSFDAGSPSEAAVDGWQDNLSIMTSLRSSTLDFSNNGDGTFNITSSSPNPFLQTTQDITDSNYLVEADLLFFLVTPSGTLGRYQIKKISETKLVLYGNDAGFATLVCDLQNLPPENPKQLSATLSDSTVSLSWSDESDDETGFKILRRDSLTGEFTEIGTASADATSYADTLTANGKYWYRVVAVNENGDSLGSNVVKVTLGDEDDTQSLKNELRMMRERMQLIEDELGESGERP